MTPRDRAGRVLLVEDSEGGAQLMRIAFGERLPDAVLEVYADGERALDDLDTGRLADWDLVLLDLKLPGVGGHEVLAAVRAAPDQRVRRLPVVVLSHSEVLDDVLRSYDLGANTTSPSRTRSTRSSTSSRHSAATGFGSSRCRTDRFAASFR